MLTLSPVRGAADAVLRRHCGGLRGRLGARVRAERSADVCRHEVAGEPDTPSTHIRASDATLGDGSATARQLTLRPRISAQTHWPRAANPQVSVSRSRSKPKRGPSQVSG
jgi:hypothetical protein